MLWYNSFRPKKQIPKEHPHENYNRRNAFPPAFMRICTEIWSNKSSKTIPYESTVCVQAAGKVQWGRPEPCAQAAEAQAQPGRPYRGGTGPDPPDAEEERGLRAGRSICQVLCQGICKKLWEHVPADTQ